LASHSDLAHRLDKMGKKYDARYKVVFDATRERMEPSSKPRSRIGFRSQGASYLAKPRQFAAMHCEMIECN